jgi:hypothetical protein
LTATAALRADMAVLRADMAILMATTARLESTTAAVLLELQAINRRRDGPRS